MTQVSKTEFRKAQCKGALDGCEVQHGVNGSDWVRSGKVIAAQRKGPWLAVSTYFLEA